MQNFEQLKEISSSPTETRNRAAGMIRHEEIEFNLRYIANRRCKQIGLPEQYSDVHSPFPGMSEMLDLKKEKTFFETRVIDYQTGGALSWD
jgi:ribonucleoside-diphosphate reductase beta chain